MRNPADRISDDITSKLNGFNKLCVSNIGAIFNQTDSIFVIIVIKNNLLLVISKESKLAFIVFFAIQMHH